jgi:hypothetical protein
MTGAKAAIKPAVKAAIKASLAAIKARWRLPAQPLFSARVIARPQLPNRSVDS